MYKASTSLPLSSADCETEREEEEEVPRFVMGEEEEKPKKVDEAPVVVVAAPPIPPPEGVEMKMFLHCEGCARKVRKSLKGFNGVEEVKTDCRTHKVFVKGKGAAEDPMKVVERVQAKTGRKVELVSPPSPPRAQEKKEEKKEEAMEIVAVMKVHMHCEACAREIKKRISRIQGVGSAETDLNASRVTVKGVFDPPKLVEYVHKRMGKRAVIIDVVPVLEEEEKENNEEKKDCEEAEEDDDKAKEEEKGNDEKKEGDKAEEEKTDEEDFDNENEDKEKKEGDKAEEEKADDEDFGNEKEKKEFSEMAAKIEQKKRNELFYYYYSHSQHLVHAPQPLVVHPPQMFSDENPNACSIM